MERIRNKEDVIKSIFLCEFHTTLGTRIVQQSPANFITKEIFDKAANYMIPKHELINRCFISITLGDLKIIGFPTCIENKAYSRNAYLTNLCFVFDHQTRTVCYESIIRKCTEYLLSLEFSSKFLSQLNEEKSKRLESMLYRIRTDINRSGSCMLKDGQNLLSLCVVPFYEEKFDEIESMGETWEHKAPVLLDCFFENYAIDAWDLTTQKIVPFLNGFRHINRIAQLAEVSNSIVCQCVKHLVLLGVCVVVPAFQYSNIYRPTPKLNQLARSPEVQKRAIEKCSKSELKKAKVRDILLLFASMTHGATLGELCVRFNPAKHNIDERKTVLFGLVENLIRPIFKYPIAVHKNLFVGYEECYNNNNNHNGSKSNDTSFLNDDSYGIPTSNKRASLDSVKITRNLFTGLKTLGND